MMFPKHREFVCLVFSVFVLFDLVNSAIEVYEPSGLPMKPLTDEENLKLSKICGKSGNLSKFRKLKLMIGGGVKAKPGEVPWAASLTMDHHNRCGGTLVSSRHVISAAHCFFSYSSAFLPCERPKLMNGIRNLQVALGGNICAKGQSCDNEHTKLYNISRFAVIAAFNVDECVKGNDLAMIELTEDVEFNEYISPACLPLESSEVAKKRLEKIDDMYSFGFSSGFLEYFHTKVTEGVISPTPFDIFNAIGDRDDDNNPQTKSQVCSGDSGGGVIGRDSLSRNRYSIMGIHSYAFDCSDQRGFTNYAATYVPLHLAEICKFSGICLEDFKDSPQLTKYVQLLSVDSNGISALLPLASLILVAIFAPLL